VQAFSARSGVLPGRYVTRPPAGLTRQFPEGKNYRVDISPLIWPTCSARSRQWRNAGQL